MPTSYQRFPVVYAVLLALSLLAVSAPMATRHPSWTGSVLAVWLYLPVLLLWGALVSGRDWIQPLVLLIGCGSALVLRAATLTNLEPALGANLLTWTAGVGGVTAFAHVVVAASEAVTARRSIRGAGDPPPAWPEPW